MTPIEHPATRGVLLDLLLHQFRFFLFSLVYIIPKKRDYLAWFSFIRVHVSSGRQYFGPGRLHFEKKLDLTFPIKRTCYTMVSCKSL